MLVSVGSRVTEHTGMRSVSLDGTSCPGLEGLDKYAKVCKEAICCEKRKFIHLEYPKMNDKCWGEEELSDKFNPKLECIRDCGNVYAILRKRHGNCRWKVVYIGTRMKNEIGKRVKEHIVKKPDSTSSKLECVKSSVWNGFDIAISYILIEPENLRLFVEQELIQQLDPPWNKRRG